MIDPIRHAHGVLEVSKGDGSHMLTLNGQTLATHPNPWSCADLAQRIAACWNGQSPRSAQIQAQFILATGGYIRWGRILATLERK